MGSVGGARARLYLAVDCADPRSRSERHAGHGGHASRRAWLLATPLLLIACVPLAGNWRAASHRGETFTADWGADLLNSVEPYGILITNGDNDTFPLWYAQEVEGVRQDVLVLVTSYLNTDWFVRQIIRQSGAAVRCREGPGDLSRKELAGAKGPAAQNVVHERRIRFPPYWEIREPHAVHSSGISLRPFSPVYLTRDQIVTLRLIKDAYPERPIYFSTGGYGRTLGLATTRCGRVWLRSSSRRRSFRARTLSQVADGYVDVTRTLCSLDAGVSRRRERSSSAATGSIVRRLGFPIPMRLPVSCLPMG